MGEVWKARDEKLDRDVAVKVLPHRLASEPEALQRFEREAKAVAALSHPNILAIHDFGESEGVRYAVMELLEGETLRDALARGPLPPKKAAECARQIVEGLAAAHARGIVHRDLKPENLFVTNDGHVKILDFGLAKMARPASSDETSSPTLARETEPGSVMGTVGYMAPEQVRGEPADHRADVFAFGAVLYEMLAGRRAFDRPTGAETMTAILRENVPPISTLSGATSPALERVIEHCLEKRAEDRFQSGRDLAFALSTAAFDSAPSRPSNAPYAPPSPGSSRSRRIALAAFAAVLLAGGAAFLLTRSRSPAAASSGATHRIAVLPLLSNDKEYDFFAEGVGDAIYGQLVKVPGLAVTGRGSSAAFKGQSVDLKDVKAKLGVDAVLQGKVSRSGDKVRIALDLVKTDDASALWSGTYDGGLSDTAKLQDTIVKEIASSLRLSIAPGQAAAHASASTEARDLYLRGHSAAAQLTKESLLSGISFYERALEKDPKMAEAYAGLSSAWAFMGDSYVSPGEAAPRCKAAALKALELDPTLAEPHFALSYASTFYDWSIPIFLAENKRAAELSHEPQFRGGYGWALCVTGRVDEGLREMDAALALDPLSPFLSMSREWGLYVNGRFQDILFEHQRAMKANVASVYLDSFEGASFRELGRLDQAIASYERDLKLYEGTPLFGLAVTYARANRMADAKKAIEALEAYRRDHYYPVELIAVAYANVGDMDRAFQWLDRVLETRSFIWYQLSRAPEWEPLRKDARWAAFKRRAGVVEQ
jgi:serine/threonine protein kinase/tetratricopeptide (TPR) repeat protein